MTVDPARERRKEVDVAALSVDGDGLVLLLPGSD